jgi:hypothetical protein
VWSDTGRPNAIRRLPGGFAFEGLEIDGLPRSGFLAWAEGVYRIAGFSLGFRSEGSVGYSYGLRIRDCDIRRETRIIDGELLLTTDVRWVERVKISDRITREIPIHVSIEIRATERASTGDAGTAKTYLVGTARGNADTSAFCFRPVRRIADRAACRELDTGLQRALAAIETGGRDYYLAGAMSAESSEIVEMLRTAIRIGRVR